MKSLSEQEKRLGLASELADIECRQQAIVQWNSRIRNFLMNMKDEQDSLTKIAEEDERNLRMIETVLTNFGIRVEPKVFTKGFIDLCSQRINDPNAPALEKLGAYALAKQNQAICASLVHKVAQVCKLDVKEAVGLFAGVETSMAKQVGQISDLMEEVGVRLMTGEERVSGITGRLRDAAVSVAGAVVNTVGKPANEMSVLNVLRMDHLKVKTIFNEIDNASAPLEKNDLFYQLRLDLLSHSEAEEQAVYRYFQQYGDIKARFDESWSEHDELRTVLDVISNVDPGSQVFLDRIRDLRTLVDQHVDKEEDEIFKLIQSKVDERELIRLAQDFITRKAQIQRRLSPHIVSGAVSSRGTDLSPPPVM
jgi:hemerythrin superfamily protein